MGIVDGKSDYERGLEDGQEMKEKIDNGDVTLWDVVEDMAGIFGPEGYVEGYHNGKTGKE